MARATTNGHSDVQPRRDGGSPGVRIDDETFAALSLDGGAASENRPQIVRWLGAWAGVDR